MPFKSIYIGENYKKCKYCNNPAKVNYYGIKRRHKGYLRTCGTEECLTRQYSDQAISAKKRYKLKNIKQNCTYCGQEFIKETHTQRWCKKCVPDKKARIIMQRYRLNKKEYLELLDTAKGKCPICLKRKAIVVDHDHKTGKVRGVLCNRCNLLLGVIENSELRERAVKYLL